MKREQLALFAAAIFAYTTPVLSATVLSPFAGPDSLSANPFFIDSRNASSVRYQQVYRESDFLIPGGPQMWITEIGFEATYSADLANVEIRLSSTPRYEDDLSSIFAQNFGPDQTVVYSGSLHVENNPFIQNGFRIPLETPFLYDRRAGNLLMEVRNHVTGTFPVGPDGPIAFMAGRNVAGDGTASVSSFDANSLTAQFLTTSGLRTLFVVTPVPEPSTTALLLATFLGFCILLRPLRNRLTLRKR